MNELNKVLITGASGLLGSRLVKKFVDGGWFVFAHFHENRGDESGSCKWIRGDFSTIKKTRYFIDINSDELINCRALVNNYGPITYRDTSEITSENLISDFQGNLIVANELTSFFIRSGNLRSVVNVAFEDVGKIKPYKKILPYSIAKAGLQLLTIAYDREYPDIKFSMVSPPPLAGGEYGKVSGEQIEPDKVADEIFDIVDKENNV